MCFLILFELSLSLFAGVSLKCQLAKNESGEKNDVSAATRIGIFSKLRKMVEGRFISKLRFLLPFSGNENNSENKSKQLWVNDDKGEGNFE